MNVHGSQMFRLFYYLYYLQMKLNGTIVENACYALKKI